MVKRYGEAAELLETRADPRAVEGVAPARFRWRGREHLVAAVLGHWREDAGWWVGGGLRVPQRDLWRLEVVGGARVVELVREGERWRVDRVWD